MSWTLCSGLEVTPENVYEKISAVGTPQADYAHDESVLAMNEARSSIEDIIVSGNLGPGPFHVSSGGHSNPDGVTDGSWATDYLTITITSTAKG